VTYSLFLFEKDSVNSEDKTKELTHCLSAIQFSTHWSQSYSSQPGPNLMEYINFLGCSPTLSSGQIESTLRLHVFKSLTGLGGESIETLRFTGCKHPIINAAQLLRDFSSQPRWFCAECNNNGNIEQINWRKTAGISHNFLEISNIFPKEALPTDSLLDSLQRCTQSEWSWFYSRSSF